MDIEGLDGLYCHVGVDVVDRGIRILRPLRSAVEDGSYLLSVCWPSLGPIVLICALTVSLFLGTGRHLSGPRYLLLDLRIHQLDHGLACGRLAT